MKFGTWAVSCAQKAAPTDPANCIALISVAKDQADQRRIVIMGLIKRDGGLSFFVQTPTTVALKPGIDLQFENQTPRHGDYSSCEPALCTVTVPLDNALASEIVGTPTASVSWTSLAAGQVKVQFSTAGSRQALDYLIAQ